ncbi:MAG TPA: SH3-like domain-containing protein, partial [Acidimicrobiia bacterium]
MTNPNAHVHLSPDAGIQTYSEPYPAFHRDGSTRGPYIPGREVLYVSAAHGDWVQVTVNGAALGWVDGRQLVPPVSGSTTRRYESALTAGFRSTNAKTLNIDVLVGALAGIGVVVGALVDWTQRIAVNSFRIPVRFLFDPTTTSSQPRLGYVVVAIGLLGIFVCFFPPLRALRILFGLLALVAAALYCGQVASHLSDIGSRLSFTDIVGPGPWVT